MAGRVYAGKSADERETERRERLLEATLDLVGERRVAELTVADICARAGLSRRYFYEQFASVHDVVDAVVDQAVEALTAAVFAEPVADVAARTHDRIERFVVALAADPRLARLILIETLGGGALAARRSELVHRAVDHMLGDFLGAADGVPSDDRRRLAAFALSGATSELLVAWIEGEVDAAADEVVEVLAGLFTHAATGG